MGLWDNILSGIGSLASSATASAVNAVRPAIEAAGEAKKQIGHHLPDKDHVGLGQYNPVNIAADRGLRYATNTITPFDYSTFDKIGEMAGAALNPVTLYRGLIADQPLHTGEGMEHHELRRNLLREGFGIPTREENTLLNRLQDDPDTGQHRFEFKPSVLNKSQRATQQGAATGQGPESPIFPQLYENPSFKQGGVWDGDEARPFARVLGRHNVSEDPFDGFKTARDSWDFGFNPTEDNSLFATSGIYSRDPLTNIARHAVSSFFDPPLIEQNYIEGSPIPLKDLGGVEPYSVKNFHFIKHRPEEYKQ